MRRAGLMAACVVVALAIAVAGGWLVSFRDTAAPVGVDEALESFRADPTSGGSSVSEGVYVYATEGYERTDALTGVTRRYPERSTIAIAAVECGLRLSWRVLDGRSTEWTYCVTDEGWELRTQDERHTFFGRTERTTYACEGTPIRRRDAAARFWNGSCSTASADEDVTVAFLGAEQLEVGGRLVQTDHVAKESAFRGAIRGTARHDYWFAAASGLPVKLRLTSRTTSSSPIGDVGYEEDVTLYLLSLRPRR